VKSYRPPSRYPWLWQWRGSVVYGCRIKSSMTGCEVIPASEPVSMVVAVAWFRGLWMPDQVRHDGVWGRTGLRAGIHYPFVIPAPEPVSMVVAVTWFSGEWLRYYVRPGKKTLFALHTNIHGVCRFVILKRIIKGNHVGSDGRKYCFQ